MKPIVSILILLVGSVNIAYSCEPIIPRHPFRDSKVVFFRELVEITGTNDRCVQIIKLKVERYWKGKPSQYIRVQTPTTLCCAYGGFHLGGRYLVYAYLERGTQLETSVGWLFTDELAETRMKKLGKGKILESIVPPNNSFNRSAG
ncbi:MAG TPA: hypothetical protein VF766_01220 [Pyrinomonadaceae bacterium]